MALALHAAHPEHPHGHAAGDLETHGRVRGLPHGDGLRLARGPRGRGRRRRDRDQPGSFTADFIISGTGHDQDVHARAELAPFADEIALWADRYTPPAELTDKRLARYPYLSKDFAFTEKVPGRAPWIGRIHDFTFGPTMSFGPSGCSISTLRLTVPMLVAGVTRGLFTEDVEAHWQDLLDYPNMIP